MNLDFDGQRGSFTEVKGRLELGIQGFVRAAGDFEFAIRSNAVVDDGNLSLTEADILEIGLSNVHLFVGTGAGDFTYDGDDGALSGIKDTNGTLITDQSTSAVGFTVSDANVNLAIIKDTTKNLKWTGVAASIGEMAAVGIDTSVFDLSVKNLNLLYNVADANGAKLNWDDLTSDGTVGGFEGLVSSLKLQVGGSLELGIDSYVKLAGTFLITQQTDVTFDDGNTIEFEGDLLAINISDVYLFVGTGAGDFTYDGDGALSGIKDTNDTLITDPSTSAVGFTVSDANVNLAIIKDTTKNLKWTGVAASIGEMAAVGIDTSVFDLSVKNLNLLYNVADADGAKLNWDDLTSDGTVGGFEGLVSSLKLQVGGSLELGIDSYVKLAGTFLITQQTDVTFDDGNTTEFEGDLLAINISDVYLFVGTGAGDFTYDGDDGALSGIKDTNGTLITNPSTSAVGFTVSDANVNLAIIKDTTENLKWTGVAASIGEMAAVGIDTSVFDLSVKNLNLLYNVADANDTKLDWDNLSADSDNGITGYDGLVKTVKLEVTGQATIQISDFVQIRGSFGFSQSTDLLVDTTDSTTQKSVSVITIGFDQVDAFVGDGPYYTGTSANPATNSDAYGLLLKDVSLALALFKPTNTSDSSSYYAVSARAEQIDLLGLNVGSPESFILDASGYRIEMNSGQDGSGNEAAINFSTQTGGATEGAFTVATGEDDVDFDYVAALQRLSIENALLKIDDYVHISGGFSFTRQDEFEVTLNDSGPTKRMVNAYAFGASNVDLFVGSGPYFEDTNGDQVINFEDTRNSDAVGLALENVNLGIMLMRPTETAHKATKYLALKASANFAGLVGIDNFELNASDISVEYNTVKGSNVTDTTPVVDFKAMNDGGYTFSGIDNASLKLDYSDRILRASVADAELQIDEYVFIRGKLAFEKGGQQTVKLSNNTTKTVSSINVGAEDLTMFFGTGGPYWTDVDGDGSISWSFNTGNGDHASRTISEGSILIGATNYTAGGNSVLPKNTIVTLGQDQIITVDGVRYGDFDGDDDNIIDANETAELNTEAVGVALTNADLGLALFKPTTGKATTKYLALKASADQLGFVGLDVFEVEGSSIVVELNLARGKGVTATTPVINFATTYPSELLALLDTKNTDGSSTPDGVLTVGELRELNGQGENASVGYSSSIGALYSADALAADFISVDDVVQILDIDKDGVLSLTEVQALMPGASDNDNDNAIAYQAGFAVSTGGTPIYLDQSRRRIVASADEVLVNVAEFVYLKGSIAIDLGSLETVTLKTGIPSAVASTISGGVGAVNGLLKDLDNLLIDLRDDILGTETETGIIEDAQTTIKDQIDDISGSVINSVVEVVQDILNNVSQTAQSALAGAQQGISDLVGDDLSATTDALFDSLISPLIDTLEDALTSGVDEPIKGLLINLISPVRKLIKLAFAKTIQAVLGDSVDRMVSSVAAAIESGLADVGTTIEAKISAVIAPQIVRVKTKIDQLFAILRGKLDAVFVELESLTSIRFGADFSTVEGVQVDVTAIGVRNATAFVGIPPDEGIDWTDDDDDGELDTSIADQDAIGLFIENLNMGLGIFKPLSRVLPSFTALKLDATAAGFVSGSIDDALTLGSERH